MKKLTSIKVTAPLDNVTGLFFGVNGLFWIQLSLKPQQLLAWVQREEFDVFYPLSNAMKTLTDNKQAHRCRSDVWPYQSSVCRN